MKSELAKRINRYFHDEEAHYFHRRHKGRIIDEFTLYENFFKGFFETHKKSTQILDIGTGTGLVAQALSRHEGHFICTDISSEMLKRTRECVDTHMRHFFNFVASDAEALSYKSGAFDVVTCNATMHHIPHLERFASELDRILAPGGTLIIGFESNRKFWNNKVVSIMYRLAARLRRPQAAGGKDYADIAKRVNERLIADGALREPLSTPEMMELVDVHSPNAGEKIDYTKGFDIDELKGFFNNYKVSVIYHYGTGPGVFRAFNRLFFPDSAPKFSLILEKEAR